MILLEMINVVELFDQRIVEARAEILDKKAKKNKGLLKMLKT